MNCITLKEGSSIQEGGSKFLISEFPIRVQIHTANTEKMLEVGIYHGDFAALAPRFSGFTSTISSLIIIYVVLRSENRLSTIYHRIMVCMALSDMMSSTAIGLTTLPMPQGVLDIHIVGTRLGTIGTCTAQGFFYTFGLVTGLSYYAILSVYYACAISLRLQEARIQKYLEPWFHVVPITLGTMASLPPLVRGLYSVSLYEAWCAFTPYPVGRNIVVSQDDVGTSEAIYEITIGTAVCITFMTILVSLAAVIYRVWQTEKSIRLCFKQNQALHEMRSNNSNNDNYDETVQEQGQMQSSNDRDFERQYQCVLRAHRTTKVILIQSMAYILVYLSVLFWPIMTITAKNGVFTYLFLVFFPLQGFFNMVIFLGHKVYSHHSAGPSLSYCTILWQIFWISPPDPVYVCRISLVEQTIDARGNLEAIGIEIQSEFGRDEEDSDISNSSQSDDNDDEENNGLRRRTLIFDDDCNSASVNGDDDVDVDGSNHSSDRDPKPNAVKVVMRHNIASTDNREERHPDTNSSNIGGGDSIGMESSLTQSMRGLGLTMIDDPSWSIAEKSQRNTNVHRKGMGCGSRCPDHFDSPSSENCSVPAGVDLNRNEDAASGVHSSMVASLDESGSYQCVHEEVGDGERSSMCDLSGFGLSEMGDTSFQS